MMDNDKLSYLRQLDADLANVQRQIEEAQAAGKVVTIANLRDDFRELSDKRHAAINALTKEEKTDYAETLAARWRVRS